jgi:hypothetical protein
MAYSFVIYTGNGVTTQFSVPFGYVRREHVAVEVNDVNTAFTWVNNNTVQVTPAPANGAEVLVKRTTPVASRLVDYTDGSTLVAADLDTDSLQHLYTEQELTDTVGNLEAFRGLYYGAYTADPTLDPFGGLPSEGDLYFNTVIDVMRVYSNSLWKNVTSDASLLRWVKTAAGGETSLSGFDINTRPLVYTPGLELVYLNGALLNRGTDYTATDGTTITGLAPLTNGDLVEVLAFTPLFGGGLASTSEPGIVQLSNSISSTSEVLAATPKAVKDAKDDAVSTAVSTAASDAAGIYLPTATAASTYLPTATAASTYLPTATAASTYLPLAGGTMTGVITYDAAQPKLTSGTAVASTSGTAIDFTGLPSWVKRVTVMFDGVSLAAFNSESNSILVRLGDSGGVETSSYTQSSSFVGTSVGVLFRSDGFHIYTWSSAANTVQGSMTFVNLSGNTWNCLGIVNHTAGFTTMTAGVKTLSATLDRIRITTPGGTDTFDAGTINILYEG